MKWTKPLEILYGGLFYCNGNRSLSWIFVALYYMFVLLPDIYWSSGEAWKENLLLSRFTAPTSAGILFTMLAAAGLKASWVYKKVQVLAIFDDLDTILLMIPLQIMMVGLRWQLRYHPDRDGAAYARVEEDGHL